MMCTLYARPTILLSLEFLDRKHTIYTSALSKSIRQAIMTWKKVLTELVQVVRSNADKFTKAFPENITTKSAVKTKNLRIDVHQVPSEPDKAVAKIWGNAGADDPAVRDFIRSKGKDSDGHKDEKVLRALFFNCYLRSTGELSMNIMLRWN